jgi:hypothetical protein
MKGRSAEFEHRLCNQLAILLGYCEVLLNETPPEGALREDLVEMHKAAVAAMQMLRSDERET